jgi:hypothetical protein
MNSPVVGVSRQDKTPTTTLETSAPQPEVLEPAQAALEFPHRPVGVADPMPLLPKLNAVSGRAGHQALGLDVRQPHSHPSGAPRARHLDLGVQQPAHRRPRRRAWDSALPATDRVPRPARPDRSSLDGPGLGCMSPAAM